MFRRAVALVLGSAVGTAIVLGAAGCGMTGGAGGGAAGPARAVASDGTGAGLRVGVRGQWIRQSAPAHLGPVNLMGVSCGGNGSHCLAVGIACSAHGCGEPEPSVIISTANGGESWIARRVPTGVGNLVAVSCPTASRCVATGDRAPFGQHSGAFLVTSDAGAHWRVVADDRIFSPGGISCPTPATCFAVGHSPRKTGAIAVTRNGGTAWTAQSLPGTIGGLSAVSCASATRCVALGISATGRTLALTTTDSGRSWSRHVMADGSLTSISCPAVSTCFAVGVDASGTDGMIAETDNGGATWTARAAPRGIGLSGVSCPSALACAVVGSHPVTELRAVAVTTNGGADWALMPIAAGRGNLFDVSCARGGTCTAVGAWLARGDVTEGPFIISNQPS